MAPPPACRPPYSANMPPACTRQPSSVVHGQRSARFQSLNRDKGGLNWMMIRVSAGPARSQSLNRDKGGLNPGRQPGKRIHRTVSIPQSGQRWFEHVSAYRPPEHLMFQSLNRDKGGLNEALIQRGDAEWLVSIPQSGQRWFELYIAPRLTCRAIAFQSLNRDKGGLNLGRHHPGCHPASVSIPQSGQRWFEPHSHPFPFLPLRHQNSSSVADTIPRSPRKAPCGWHLPPTFWAPLAFCEHRGTVSSRISFYAHIWLPLF